MTYRVGLTGGIGTGKSTAARLLAARGAALVDADLIAREVVEPGRRTYDAVVARFGPGVVGPDQAIDRAALAAVVFADPVALADLNAITHPAIGAVMLERLSALDGTVGAEGIAVAVIPLLRAAHVDALGLRAVVVVDCPFEVALRRLVASRGMDEEDARARLAAQPSRDERLALADYVLDNSSTREHLVAGVDALWERLGGRRAPG